MCQISLNLCSGLKMCLTKKMKVLGNLDCENLPVVDIIFIVRNMRQQSREDTITLHKSPKNSRSPKIVSIRNNESVRR